MAANLNYVIERVNRALPEYGRGIVSPYEMESTGKANCFGRLAVIGAGLIVEGANDQASLGWLISLSHGFEFKPRRYWLGHAFLTIIEQSESCLVDATDYAYSCSLSRTTWRPGDTSHRPFIDLVVNREIIEGKGGIGQHTPDTTDSLSYAQAWLLRSALARYDDFSQGIREYQGRHPMLQGTRYEPADYIRFFEKVVMT